MMQRAVISDTSPLNYLILIEAAEVLPRIASRLIVPPAVLQELSHRSTPQVVRSWIAHPPTWLEVVAPRYLNESLGLDAGETEAISLALELGIRSVLIDERKGFHTAVRHGLEPFGLLAVLEYSANKSWLDFEECLLRLRGTTFRMNELVVSGIRARLSR